MNERSTDEAVENRRTGKHSVGEVARLFIKLGTIAFGGPAAHIAMMHDEVCRRRRWRPRSSSRGENTCFVLGLQAQDALQGRGLSETRTSSRSDAS